MICNEFLLALIPLSRMVVPVRDIGNKYFSTSATMSSVSRITLPTDMGMDINNIIGSNANNYNNVRDYTMISNKSSSKTVLMFSSKTLVDYTTKIKHLNNFSENKEIRESIDSSQLLYMMPGEQGNQVSKVADSSSTKKQQCVYNKDLALNKATNSNKNMFNI